MARILLISGTGYTLACYPKDDPLLSQGLLKPLSRLCNTILVPALILHSLGTGVTIDNLGRMAILIPCCAGIVGLSYFFANTVGRLFHEDDQHLFRAYAVAVGSPNAISFPMLVMDSLCKQNDKVNADFDGDTDLCFAEATSMLFVYTSAWFFCFWGYGFPVLQSLVDPRTGQEYPPGAMAEEERHEQQKMLLQQKLIVNETTTTTTTTTTDSGGSGGVQDDAAAAAAAAAAATAKTTILGRLRQFHTFKVVERVLTSVPIVCTVVGMGIGLITPLQNALFFDFTALTPIGSSLFTLAQPVLAINCMIMAASLASVDLYDMLKPDSDSGSGSGDDGGDDGGDGSGGVGGNRDKCGADDHDGRHEHAEGGTASASAAGDIQMVVTTRGGDHGDEADSDQYQHQHQHDRRIHLRTRAESFTDTDGWIASSTAASGGVGGVPSQLVQQQQRFRSGSSASSSLSADEPATPHLQQSGGNYNPQQQPHLQQHMPVPTHDIRDDGLYNDHSINDATGDGGGTDRTDDAATAAGAVTNDERKNSKSHEEDGTVPLPRIGTIFAFLLCRLVLPPAVVVPLVALCVRTGLIKNKMVALIIIIESGAPSAQTLIVAMNQLGLRRAAGQMSVLYVFQYAASVLTVTLCTTVALAVVLG
jgi:predicted permease